MAAKKKSAPVTVGSAIKSRRVAQGLTQAEAADKGGISLKSWARIETAGFEDFSDLTAAGIDRALGWPTGTTMAIRGGGAPPEAIDERVLLDVSDLNFAQFELLQVFLKALRS